MQMNRWQRASVWLYLNAVGLRRRMTLGSRVMLVDGDKVLLIRHSYIPGWGFPGGGVEPGETAEESALREVVEETGYKPIGPMELFGLYHNNNPVTNRDHVAFYISRRFEKVFDFKPTHEISEIGWFHKSALPEKITPSTSQRIDEFFDKAEKRAIWGY
ncbi:NUDIX domain-containing protein [Devosia geojensis]|nr:NUDIX domain-containing protein [Devosia geojensis]